MTGLAHPLEDVLCGLVESDNMPPRTQSDSGWTWMVVLVVAIGLLAWFTR